jgi:hypothetical protein
MPRKRMPDYQCSRAMVAIAHHALDDLARRHPALGLQPTRDLFAAFEQRFLDELRHAAQVDATPDEGQ